jgi:hypothetical protein
MPAAITSDKEPTMRNVTEESTTRATPDSIFSMLALAQQKSKALEAASDNKWGEAHTDEWEAVISIVASKPTTVAGVAAVLRFFAARVERDAILQQELMKALLGNMALVLDRIEEERPS